MRRKWLTAFVLAAALILCGCGSNTEGGEPRNGDVLSEAKEEEFSQNEPEEEAAQREAVESAPVQEESEVSEPAEGEAETETSAQPEAAQPVSGTFSVMGDSISTFRDHNPEGYHIFFPENGNLTDVADTWWQQAAEELDLTLLVNASSSGATVAGDSTGTADPQTGCDEFRTDALAGPDGACPETIIIYLGTNDMLQAIPLGDNNGERPVEEGIVMNFSDAYTLMLDKLERKYPGARIYCCTLHQMGKYDGEPYFLEFVNGLDLTVRDYGEVIAGIARTRGHEVIDLYDCGITVENLLEMTSDGVHPTAAGMGCIAGAVEEALSCR